MGSRMDLAMRGESVRDFKRERENECGRTKDEA